MLLKSHFSTSPTIECGCDEAGRGCLAGPVCAAAVIFPYDYTNPEINDSKQLSEKKREQLRETILKDALAWAVTEVSAGEIDRMNILRASIHAMNLAVGQLSVTPELLLIDGNRFTDQWGIPWRCIVKGDATYLSIAAASILAKTHRDAIMRRLSDEFPATPPRRTSPPSTNSVSLLTTAKRSTSRTSSHLTYETHNHFNFNYLLFYRDAPWHVSTDLLRHISTFFDFFCNNFPRISSYSC